MARQREISKKGAMERVYPDPRLLATRLYLILMEMFGTSLMDLSKNPTLSPRTATSLLQPQSWLKAYHPRRERFMAADYVLQI